MKNQTWSIEWTSESRKQLLKLDRPVQKRILTFLSNQLTLALVVLCSVQFDALASINGDLENGATVRSSKSSFAQPIVQSYMDVDIHNMMQIFTYVAHDGKTNLGYLRLVCKRWKIVFDRLTGMDPEENTAHKRLNPIWKRARNIFKSIVDRIKIQQRPAYASLHPMWKSLVKASYGGLGNDAFYETFANLRLYYRWPWADINETVILPISDFKNPFCGTFNLARCGDARHFLVFTTSLKKFCEVGGKNKDKLVILFAPRGLISQRMDLNAAPFYCIMNHSCIIYHWKSDFGIFMRWGNETDSWTDYLINNMINDKVISYRYRPCSTLQEVTSKLRSDHVYTPFPWNFCKQAVDFLENFTVVL